MICKNRKPPPLQYVSEVPKTSDTGQQLAVKRGVFDLGAVHLLRKESQGPPQRRRVGPLLEGCADAMCSAEVSTCRATSAPGVGWMRRTHPVRATFAAENAACMSAVHGMAAAGLGPPFNWSVSGFRMWAAAGINRR